MMEFINDIKKSLKNKTYLSALTLALTIPDICSQVEAKKDDGNREMYIAWFNKYVYSEAFEFDKVEFREQAFDGNMCYALRCKVLHNGNLELKKANPGLQIRLDCFQLSIPASANYYHGYKYAFVPCEDGTKQTVTILAVDYLCEMLCDAAEKFYNCWQEKEDFKRHQIKFTQ